MCLGMFEIEPFYKCMQKSQMKTLYLCSWIFVFYDVRENLNPRPQSVEISIDEIIIIIYVQIVKVLFL